MTDLKFNILKLLYESYPSRELNFGDIINSVSEDPNLIQIALKELLSHPNKPIEKLPCNNIYKLTDSGAELYEQEAENRTKEAKHKKQHILNIILTVATLLATILLSEPVSDLITFLTEGKS